jgi:murein L,D-transpeptidase YafK
MARTRFPGRAFIAVVIVLVTGFIILCTNRALRQYLIVRLRGEKTVGDVIREKESTVRERLRPYLERAGCSYPLRRITFLAFKQEKMLELWAEEAGAQRFIRSYPILAASGHAGPKLREGDRQVPEGFYHIIALNPNGDFYLTMLIDYPNSFDLKNAESEKRANPGGDICIHGKAASIGCLAMGDTAIEELFILVARAGAENVTVIISPNDLRDSEPAEAGQMSISWVPGLYGNIKKQLSNYPSAKRAISP